MRCLALMVSVVAAFSGASCALADCTVSKDDSAAPRTLNPSSPQDADLILSMSMMPKMMHLDYASASKKAACDLGGFTAGTKTYELFGDDKAGRQRMAISIAKGDPIAEIVPVTNILKAIEASKQGKTAAVDGYMLATVSKTDFIGWRFYTGIPDKDVLEHDMAEALTGNGAPIFQNGADGKTSLFVPKS